MHSTVIFLVLLGAVAYVYCIDEHPDKDGLKIEVLSTGPDCKNRKARNGDKIVMGYKGVLASNGKEFDSSYSPGREPLEFVLGKKQVIQGWEKGIIGMCPMEKRKLTIPPELAYGDQGFGDVIPANSTLIFDVELIAIKTGISDPLPTKDNDDISDLEDSAENDSLAFEKMDKNKDNMISSQEFEDFLTGEFGNRQGEDEGDGEDKTELSEIKMMVSEIFQEDDKNKDGVLSREEYELTMGHHSTDDTEPLDEEEIGEDEDESVHEEL